MSLFECDLDEREVEEAVRLYLAQKRGMAVPETARFWWMTGQEVFSGVSIEYPAVAQTSTALDEPPEAA